MFEFLKVFLEIPLSWALIRARYVKCSSNNFTNSVWLDFINNLCGTKYAVQTTVKENLG